MFAFAFSTDYESVEIEQLVYDGTKKVSSNSLLIEN